MPIHCIRETQKFPIGLQEAWDFISSPHNLQTITPPDFSFEIMNGVKQDDKMYAGQIIIYKLQVIPGMRTTWVTEISQVKHLEYFIDIQLKGPYSIWHHQHFIKPIEGGIQMDDIIHYKIPYGYIGEIANKLFVKRKLKSVFAYRRQQLEKIFGTII